MIPIKRKQCAKTGVIFVPICPHLSLIPTKKARKLRKNATRAESLVWSKLRAKQINGVKFRRQQPIGNYIVDFVSFEKKIIIELDGGQHARAKKKDSKRDKLLSENGFTVLRFWNNDVLKNPDGVIHMLIEEITPSPLSPPFKGGDVIVDGGS